MSPDFRALCAELIDALDSGIPAGRIRMSPLADRARAALSQPEPVAPTDEELTDMAEFYIDDNGLLGLHNAGDYARAILARWGTPAIQPVPVSERLPGPEDCDADGRCWWWHPDHKEDDFDDGWILLNPKWAGGRRDSDDSPIYTHWLPANALPTPEAK